MTRFHPAIIVLVTIVAVVVSRDVSSDSAQSRPSTVSGELLLRWRETDEGGLRLAIRPLTANLSFLAGMEDVHYNRYLGLWRIQLPPDKAVSSVEHALRDAGAVDFAQPNYVYSNADAPDDPLYLPRQQTYYRAINAPAAWATGVDGSGVTVAVIDGGVDINHPELAGGIWENSADPSDGLDNDGNGCLDDTNGCSFQGTVPTGDVHDYDGHGTFGSGIVAAAAGNGEGVAGVAPGATIMPVRALDAEGIGTTEQLAASVLYAARNGAHVINLSLALLPEAGTCPGDPLVEDALGQAHDDFGVTIIAAAGNFNLGCVGFPASSAYTIAVGASGPHNHPDVRAFFSQWGPEIDVAAPGIDITSTCPMPTLTPTGFCPGEAYGTGSGTSFSAPIVSGAAALLLSQDPGRTHEDIRQRLRATALPLPDDITQNWDGAGRLDLAAALGAGSGYVVLDIEAPDASLLTLRVVVGDPALADCDVSLWERPQAEARNLHGTLGVGECAAFWPPSPVRPWSLHGQSDARKTARLSGWSLRMEGAACTGEGGAVVPRAGDLLGASTCAGSTLVANDASGSAITVDPGGLPLRYEVELLHATSAGDPAVSAACANATSRGTWYRVAPPTQATAIAADTFGSGFDTVLAVFEEDPSSLREIACNNNFNSPQSRLVWTAEAGKAYLVFAAAYQAVPAGRLRLNFSNAEVPPNDLPDGALALAPNAVLVQPAHSATPSVSDPAFSCVPFYDFSMWFRIPAASGPLTVSTTGSDYDTVMAVFREGPAGALDEVACNDQEGPGLNTSRAAWTGDGGDYVVVVGAYPGFPGGVLHLGLQPD